MVEGLRIIGDMILGKGFSAHDNEFYRQNILALIADNGFTVTGDCYKDFGSGAFSHNVMLAESHVCVHTWPESNFYSLDIHTCNYTRDNSEATRKMADEIIELFDTDRDKSHLREISSASL